MTRPLRYLFFVLLFVLVLLMMSWLMALAFSPNYNHPLFLSIQISFWTVLGFTIGVYGLILYFYDSDDNET